MHAMRGSKDLYSRILGVIGLYLVNGQGQPCRTGTSKDRPKYSVVQKTFSIIQYLSFTYLTFYHDSRKLKFDIFENSTNNGESIRDINEGSRE